MAVAVAVAVAIVVVVAVAIVVVVVVAVVVVLLTSACVVVVVCREANEFVTITDSTAPVESDFSGRIPASRRVQDCAEVRVRRHDAYARQPVSRADGEVYRRQAEDQRKHGGRGTCARKARPPQTKRLPSSAYSRICAPSQMELALDNVMELFRYLNAKDVRALLCSRCNRCEYRRRAWLTRLFPRPCLLCRCLRHFTKRTWQRGSCSARARRSISRSR